LPIGVLLVAVVSMLVAPHALAHDGHASGSSLFAAVLHPLTSLEHLLPLVALGLLAGQGGFARGRAMVAPFAVVFAASSALGLAHGATAGYPVLGATTALVAGSLVALALTLPQHALYAATMAVGAVTGFAHAGGAHATGMPALTFVVGTTVCASLVVLATAGFAGRLAAHRDGWRQIAVRALGSWIAAFGMLTLAVASLPARATLAGL